MSQLTTEICISQKGYSMSAPFTRSTLLHSCIWEWASILVVRFENSNYDSPSLGNHRTFTCITVITVITLSQVILLLRTWQLAPTVTCGSLFRSNELEERVKSVELDGATNFSAIHCSEHCPE